MTCAQHVAKWQKAFDKTMKEALSKKGGGRKLLIKAGILDKSGKRLAKPYR